MGGMAEETLRALVEASAQVLQGSFFDALVVRLTRLLGVRYAFVGELVDSDNIRMLAYAEHSQLRTPQDYSLAGTPCETVIGGELREYVGKVWKRFPEDRALEEMHVECYMGAPIFSGQGEPRGIVAVLHDDVIADRLNTAAMLRVVAAHCSSEIERENALREVMRLASLARDTPQAVVELSSDLRILATNPAADELIGSLLGVDTLSSHSVWDKLSTAARYVSAKGSEQRFEHRVNGRWLRWLLLPSRVEERVHAFPLDVTELRELEAQLRHAQRVQTIGTLAGGVAHDFNNHLLIIRANAELALESCADSERELLEDILAAVKSASNVTRQLLRHTHTTSDGAHTVLDQVVRDTMRLVRRTTPRRIELNLVLETGTDAVQLDPADVANIVINLCRNATDAIEGRGTIEVRTQRVKSAQVSPDASGDFLVIQVLDDGVGMTSEVRERAMEPFFTTKPPGLGTGLGLAGIWSLADDLGGFVRLEDRAPGTSVSIFVPALGPEELRPRTVSDLPPSRSFHVLVVEDDPLAQRVLVRVLEKAGHSVVAASDGVEAIELFDAHQTSVDIALIDMDLPKRSGREVRASIRRIVPSLPVILMSGLQTDDAEVQLRKPFTPRDVLRAVATVWPADGERPSDTTR